jgi:DhnA family fructose-bisphosphate aldolase class Ia
MKMMFRMTALVALAAAAGCTAARLAPGADQVRITNKTEAVASCKAVGNVKARSSLNSDKTDATIRNQAVGLGANTVLFMGYVGSKEEGVAYNCP